MYRIPRRDAVLDRLNDERDDLAVQVSLAWDADPPDLPRLSALQRKLDATKREIYRHKATAG